MWQVDIYIYIYIYIDLTYADDPTLGSVNMYVAFHPNLNISAGPIKAGKNAK